MQKDDRTERPQLSVRAEELLAERATEYGTTEGLFGTGGLVPQLTRRLVERALEGEVSHHLGYERHDPSGHLSGNSCNGHQSRLIALESHAFTEGEVR